MRVRIHFAKTDAMRYTGHLDLHHTWERTIRRANLPLAYTQGFRPRPRINLASALPLGFTSQDEVVDIWLKIDLPLADIESSLIKALPPGIEISSAETIADREAALQTQLQSAVYLITLLETLPDLEIRLEEICQSDSLPRRRRGKDYDLRPLIMDLQVDADDDQGRQRLRAVLSSREGATGRPDEVILAMGGDPTLARVERTRLIFN
ncbi:MAG: TIGR03936 family radical SAM-associated protein [Anaerolineales bacterium]